MEKKKVFDNIFFLLVAQVHPINKISRTQHLENRAYNWRLHSRIRPPETGLRLGGRGRSRNIFSVGEGKRSSSAKLSRVSGHMGKLTKVFKLLGTNKKNFSKIQS